MRQIAKFLVLIIVFLSGLCGCGSIKNKENTILNRKDIDLANVAIVGVGNPCLETNPYEYMRNNTDAIILGEVTQVNYITDENGLIYTIETIAVYDQLEGEHLPDEINVWKLGGISTISNYLNSYDDEIRNSLRETFSKLSDEELECKYISQFEMFDIPSEVGMRFVLSLEVYPKETADYHIVCDRFGEFLEIGEGNYFTTACGLTYKAYLTGEYLSYLDAGARLEDQANITLSKEQILKRCGRSK